MGEPPPTDYLPSISPPLTTSSTLFSRLPTLSPYHYPPSPTLARPFHTLSHPLPPSPATSSTLLHLPPSPFASFLERAPDLAAALRTQKLENCGVVCAELALSAGRALPIVDAHLMLGSQLEEKKTRATTLRSSIETRVYGK